MLLNLVLWKVESGKRDLNTKSKMKSNFESDW
jgi:hypothetical protein